jgi:ligand-binding sensor domain-containing protein
MSVRFSLRWVSTAITALVIVAPAWAQPATPRADQFIRRSWDTRDGLPQNTITAIAQTRDGYLWLGTFGGLVRFDGNAFTVFDPGNSPGLTSARIISLLEDRHGVLWVGTEAGVVRYEHRTFSAFPALTAFATRDGLARDGVPAITEDGQGRLWFATDLGLARFDGKAFTWVTVADVQESAQVLAAAPNGDVWAGRWTGATRFEAAERPAFVDASGDSTLSVSGWAVRSCGTGTACARRRSHCRCPPRRTAASARLPRLATAVCGSVPRRGICCG